MIETVSVFEQMDFDELGDFIDYAQYYYQTKFLGPKKASKLQRDCVRRRRGKHTGTFPGEFKNPKNILSMSTSLQRQVDKIASRLQQDDLFFMLTIAGALYRAKQPVYRTSRGSIQVKKIPYERVSMVWDDEAKMFVPELDENGKLVIRKMFGEYLYLRYWVVQGNNDRGKKRVKSLYIGGVADLAESISDDYEYPYKVLVDFWLNLIRDYGIERTRTVTEKSTGRKRVQHYKVRPSGGDNPISKFEMQILECIDMSHVPPLIDHEALLELQESL